MRHLQLGPLATKNGKILTPVKLERLASLKDQRHESSAPRRLLFALPIRAPSPGKGRHTAVRPSVTQLHQVIMQLLRCSPLLARLSGLSLQPARQFCREGIKFAGPLRNAERWLNSPRSQILANGIARQLRPSRDLPNGQMLPQSPTPNNAQKCHVDHSKIPCCQQPRGRSHMGHFSMKITPIPGSLPSGNQHPLDTSVSDRQPYQRHRDRSAAAGGHPDSLSGVSRASFAALQPLV
jgi:hypothetical protein